jgi:hypothetical protein
LFGRKKRLIGGKDIERVYMATGEYEDVARGSVGYIEMIVRLVGYSGDTIEAIEDPMALPTS